MTTRSEIRKKMRLQRHQLDKNVALSAANHATRLIENSHFFHNSRRIALYFPNDGELDITLLLDRLWSMKKICYLPVLDRLSSNRLWFAPYEKNDHLCVNRFGIPEPRLGMRHYVPARSLDLVLMPLIAFDTQGNRLGMGGGYYDRTLSFLRSRRHWQRPLLIGVAYEFQKTSSLTSEDWDIPLHGIVTENSVYTTKTQLQLT